MKIRNFLVNSIFLTIFVIVILGLRYNGFFTATLLRKDIIYYGIWMPLVIIYLTFSIFYIYDGKHKLLSAASILTAICIAVVGVLTPTIYITTSPYLQLIVFVILYLMILASAVTVFLNRKQTKARS